MYVASSLLGCARKNAVRQLNLACAVGLRTPEETDSGCSDGYSSDSSLSPSSPAVGGPPELRFSLPAPEDDLRRRTFCLLRDFYRECTGAAPAKGVSDPALSTLRRVGGEVVEKHRIAFRGMVGKLDIKGAEDLERVLVACSHTFEDGVTNWGRIVAVISFGALVAQHLKSLHLESSIDTLAEKLTGFLMEHKRDWITNHQQWDGFTEFFHVEDVEVGIRKVLLTLATFAGVGAGLAYMIR